MILFVCDQIAGAEYILPALLDLSTDELPRKIFASPVSSRLLSANNIEHEVITDLTRETIATCVSKHDFSYAVMSTSTASPLERFFALALKEKNIPFAQFIDQWVNYKERFLFEGELLYPNIIFTLDEIAKNEMVAVGIPESLIKIMGQPHLEFQTNQNTIKKNKTLFKGNQKTLLISQPITKFYSRSLGYTEFDFLECACDTWKKLEKNWSDITIAIHPSEEDDKYISLIQKYSSQIVITKNAGQEIWLYSNILGMFSLLMTQGVLLGIPTASLQPKAIGEDRCFLSQKGYIPKLIDAEQCALFLQNKNCDNSHLALKKIVDGSINRLKTFLLQLE